MKNNFLLLLLQACVFSCFRFFLSFSFAEAFLVSYCFATLASVFFNTSSRVNPFRFLLFFNGLGFVLYIVLSIYNIKPPATEPLSPTHQKIFLSAIQKLSPPSQDRTPFVRTMTYVSLLQFDKAKNSVSQLIDTSYKKLLRQWVNQKERGFNDLVNLVIHRYPQVKNLMNLFYSEKYEDFYSRLTLLKSSSETDELRAIVLHLGKIKADLSLLEEEIMKKHLDFISFAPKYTEKTLALIPGTLKYTPKLLEGLDKKPKITLFDFYFIPSEFNTLQGYPKVSVKDKKLPIQVQFFMKDPQTDILWGINVKIASHFYSLIKILPNDIVYLNNSSSIVKHVPSVQEKLNDTTQFITHPLYFQWFKKSYVKNFPDYYRAHILPAHKELLFFVLGFVGISILTGITYKALFTFIRERSFIFTYILASCFLLFLCYLYSLMIFGILHQYIPLIHLQF